MERGGIPEWAAILLTRADSEGWDQPASKRGRHMDAPKEAASSSVSPHPPPEAAPSSLTPHPPPVPPPPRLLPEPKSYKIGEEASLTPHPPQGPPPPRLLPEPEADRIGEDEESSCPDWGEEADEEPSIANEEPAVVSVVKAIVGWKEPIESPHTPTLRIASLTLRGIRLTFALGGAQEAAKKAELWRGTARAVVQCGSGRWEQQVQGLRDLKHFDLSKWSRFEGDHGGQLPKLEEDPEHKAEQYGHLIEDFRKLWSLIRSGSGTNLVGFYCKAGRHRSFALLIAFLMWACHVHSPGLWAGLISTVRNKLLPQERQCELAHPEDLTLEQHKASYVPFAAVLQDFAKHLNANLSEHAWPYA